jgi:hypothetical protein
VLRRDRLHLKVEEDAITISSGGRGDLEIYFNCHYYGLSRFYLYLNCSTETTDEIWKFSLKSHGPAEAEPSLTALARPETRPSRGPLQAGPKPQLWAEAEPAHH